MCEDKIITPTYNVNVDPIPIDRDSKEVKNLIDKLMKELYKNLFDTLGINHEKNSR